MSVMKINWKKRIFVVFAVILPINSVSLRTKAVCLDCLIRTFKIVEKRFLWTGGLAIFNILTIDGNATMHWRRACHAILNKAKASGQKRNMRKKTALQNLATGVFD